MTTEETKTKRGRPTAPPDLRQATFELVNEISRRSELTPAALEELFGMASNPPGNNWRRYLRGERTLAAEQRERIAKIAHKKGWLIKRNNCFKASTHNGYMFALTDTLAACRAREKEAAKRKKEMQRQVDACISSIKSLHDNLKKIDELYWLVLHFDPEDNNCLRQQLALKHLDETQQVLNGLEFDFFAGRSQLP